MTTRKEVTGRYRGTAWCKCGDELQCIEVIEDDGFIDKHEYYCLGCDDTYELVKKGQ